MTAFNPNSAGCENPVFRATEDGISPANARLIVPLIQYIDNSTGGVDRLELSKEFRLQFFELDRILRWLEKEEGLVLRGSCPNEEILLTSKGRFVWGDDD